MKRGQVLCVVCRKALPAVSAVVMNGQAAHPIGCFDKLIKARVDFIKRTLRDLGGAS